MTHLIGMTLIATATVFGWHVGTVVREVMNRAVLRFVADARA